MIFQKDDYINSDAFVFGHIVKKDNSNCTFNFLHDNLHIQSDFATYDVVIE